jgi:membrane fusion protein (multidrug efflux system)
MTAALPRPRLAGHRSLASAIGIVAVFSVFPCAAQTSPPPLSPSLLPSSAGAPELRAQLTPREYTTLSSEMAGRIDQVKTRVGEHFHKDDVLVVFDCAQPRAQLAKAHAVATQADKTFAINQRLVALKSMGQLELDVSGAEVQKAKADVAGAEAVASKCSISAPFSGVTVDQKAREFQYATPGQPLLDVLDDHALEVEKTYSAKITRLGGRVDPVSQSIKVIGEITGNAPELMAGMSGRATLTPP